MEAIELSQKIYDFIADKNFCWEGSRLKITDIVINHERRVIITELEDEANQFELFSNGKRINSYELVDESICEIRLSPPQDQNCFFAKDLDQLLKRDFALHPGVQSLIISDSSFISWQNINTPTNEIKAYFSLHQLLTYFIDEGVAIKTKVDQISIVFANTSTSFDLQIDKEFLKENSSKIIDGSEKILNIFKDSVHKEEKIRLLKSEILRLTQSSPQNSRFKHLCKLLDDIAINFSANYDIFVSKFSFQSEKEKLNDELTTFSKKINEVTSTIQTQILAIPLTLILSYSQMKTDVNENPLLVNSFVVIASMIFSILVFKLLTSRELTLSLLESEINSKIKRFRTDLPEVFILLEKEFCIVRKQVKKTKNMILFLKTILFAGSISTIMMFFILTPQFQ